jgi:hypothetical protein
MRSATAHIAQTCNVILSMRSHLSPLLSGTEMFALYRGRGDPLKNALPTPYNVAQQREGRQVGFAGEVLEVIRSERSRAEHREPRYGFVGGAPSLSTAQLSRADIRGLASLR